METLYRKPNKFLMDYEWHYYIGGSCTLRRKKYGGVLARIEHVEQGVYEAFINRKNPDEESDYISVGVFNNSNEAQAIINQILEEKFNENTDSVRRMD